MLDFSQMALRFFIALVLGALVGLERESVGKEAGIRTSMMVAGGSAIFTIIGISLPYLIATPAGLADVIAHNSGFLAVIANIVVGIGFLGAGIIIKTEERVFGLTTAAVVWITAAVGVLTGLGLIKFATLAAVIISGTLYLLRKIGIREHLHSLQDADKH
jgi:putative Mg2+ transporter-C (MgtC) family protein